ncbi:MAG TPA: farnesyl diphosphate synthase [Candidatus Dormibacteraeota bacterium]|nr:farnesyl diphosphate synthase [Candidatus Dormibacteraeota bacterium]
MKLRSFLEENRAEVDRALDRLLPAESTQPESIHRAMRYSALAGGKRIRPSLCLEAARLFHADPRAAIDVACALEFIHAYSLIHDDLPALDNDDLRRGKPTCHKQFGEAMAILAGDGLLTLAFETLAKAPLAAQRLVRVIREIATAAGTVGGMVGGQVADVEAEGKAVDPAGLEYIHRAKTAALIRASAVSGALTGSAGDDDIARIGRFGEQIGWAFQVIDDILDVEESSAALGKTAGKDAEQKKATYPALYGLEESRQTAERLASAALRELDPYGAPAWRLRELAEFLTLRRA